MNQYKLMFLTIMLLLSFGAVTAQESTKKKQELSVYGKGFLNSLKYDLSGGTDVISGAGVGLGLQYALYMNNNWSVSAGLEYQQYHSKAVLRGFSDSYQTTDIEGADFDFYCSADRYEEKQSVNMLNIPIVFRYETPAPWINTYIYGAAGFQLGIPVSSKYNATAENLITTGYYQQWDAMLFNPSFMGFGSWGTIERNNQELDFGRSYTLLFEVGFKHQLEGGQNIYIGYYADLGLTELIKDSNSVHALIEYDADNPMEFKLNPLVYSAPQAQGEAYITRPKIRGFGIKIQYAFEL